MPTDRSSEGDVTLRYETPEWEAIYEIRAADGRPVIASIQIKPRTDDPVPPELPATLARELVRPGEALKHAHAFLGDLGPLRAWVGLESYHDLERHRGKRRPDYFYAAIASAYLQALKSGSRKPVADAAAVLPQGYEAKFVSDALTRARRRGLLTRPDSKRAGGHMTSLGQGVLDAGPPKDYLGPLAPVQA